MSLSAGFGTVDITPPLGISLAAYSRAAGAQGILDHLQATALVLETGATRLALLHIDNVGMWPRDVDVMRAAVAADLQITPAQVMVLFTHTHAGPDTDDHSPVTTAYRQTLTANVAHAARLAAANLRPARIGWGVTRGQIGMNRRAKVNGRAVMGDNTDGPVDERIGVLKVEDATTGKLLGLLVTCTAHANVLKGDNQLLSADFPGWTRRYLEQRLDCPVLVRIGAAGNVNARYRGGVDDLERMAQAIGGPVLALLPELPTLDQAVLWCNSSTLAAPLLDAPEPAAARELAQVVSVRWGVDTQPWLDHVQAMLARGQRSHTLNLEVQLCRIGNGSLAGIPLEPFAETAIGLAQRLGDPLHFFGGYTNGWTGYLPTAAEFAYGGYEVDWNPVYMGWQGGLYMPAQPQVADLVCAAVAELHAAAHA